MYLALGDLPTAKMETEQKNNWVSDFPCFSAESGSDRTEYGECNYSLISTGHRSSGDHARGARELGGSFWNLDVSNCEGRGRREESTVVMIMGSVISDSLCSYS
jgi:hypothetical protein